jgi:predicted RNase H-like HicB family nuclease
MTVSRARMPGCVLPRHLADCEPMKATRQFTAVIQQEGKWFVALCPELDVASQGKTVEQARKNLTEAVELLLEVASPSELKRRLHRQTYVTQLEVAVG